MYKYICKETICTQLDLPKNRYLSNHSNRVIISGKKYVKIEKNNKNDNIHINEAQEIR